MLRSVILAASRSKRLEKLIEAAPPSRAVVRRFVAGVSTEDALSVARSLAATRLTATLDYLGEDSADPAQADVVKAAYLQLIAGLVEHELTGTTEVSLKLSALGQRFDRSRSVSFAAEICRVAREAGTTVTLDMEDHTTTDTTLEALVELRKDFPETGAVLQAQLRRTEADCRDLATSGSRVRLCKGAYEEPESVAFRSPYDVARSYVRCTNALLAGAGYPMFATHDPRLIDIVIDRAPAYGRDDTSFEFQLLYGVRPEGQRRLAALGYLVRVYVPYGTQWYGYLMRRLAERPANLTFFLRSLASRR